MTPARVIDSHIHLWDPTVLRYPWLDSEEELGRPFLPADLHASGGSAGVGHGAGQRAARR